MGDRLSTRQAFGSALVKLGRLNEKVVVLDADISKSTATTDFHHEFPERSFNFGIAEQNLMGIAAGLATTGLTVFTSTYAVFASMRACEQVRTFICYPNLNVKVCASHGGLHVGADGATHQGIEDIAIMRALPNMTVVQPADPREAEAAVMAIAEYRGPVYLRLIRNAVPDIYGEDYRFELGKAVTLRETASDQAVIFATGIMVSRALRAAEALAEDGVGTRVVNIHTIKPLDLEAVRRHARETGAVVTAEDHTIIGGLGSAIAEALGESAPAPMKRVGIPDVFGESGAPDELLDHYGMAVDDLVKAVRQVIDRKQMR